MVGGIAVFGIQFRFFANPYDSMTLKSGIEGSICVLTSKNVK